MMDDPAVWIALFKNRNIIFYYLRISLSLRQTRDTLLQNEQTLFSNMKHIHQR